MTTTRTALFVSPHLDDVAFSCAGTLAALKAWVEHGVNLREGAYK